MASPWWQLGGCQPSATLGQLQLQGGELPAQTGLVRSLPARALSPTAAPGSFPDGRALRKTKRNIKRPTSKGQTESAGESWDPGWERCQGDQYSRAGRREAHGPQSAGGGAGRTAQGLDPGLQGPQTDQKSLRQDLTHWPGTGLMSSFLFTFSF